jgi:hypothetical protein
MTTALFLKGLFIFYLFRCFVFTNAFLSPLSKTKLLLPFVSFTFPAQFLLFIPPLCLFPSP